MGKELNLKYEVWYANQKVSKSLNDLPLVIQDRVKEAIQSLASNPRPSGVKMLSGRLKGIWRLRAGDYRLLYDIDDKAKKIILLELGHRRQIYR